METIRSVLELWNRVLTFVINSEKVEIKTEPDYVQEDPRDKAVTESRDFISATSEEESDTSQ